MRIGGVILFAGLVLTSACNASRNAQSAGPSSSSQLPSNATPPAPASSNESATPGLALLPVTSPSVEATPKGNLDPCALLTSAQIRAVQGEPIKATKSSERSSENFTTALCYYELTTLSKSVSLSYTQNQTRKSGGQSLKEFWESRFGKSEREKEGDQKEERASPPRDSEEAEESAPMEAVSGIGDEAFWAGNRVGGALYVLKGDRFLRISVGGPADNEARLRKSKKLARAALRHL